MHRLQAVTKDKDILPQFRNTPIMELLQYHNLDRPFKAYPAAQMLVGMCMDNRKHLRIPDNFSFILRTGGANLRYSEFKISYAIGVGGIKAISLIGHNQCGMVNLVARKKIFVDGLVKRAGWKKRQAEEYFLNFAPMFEIGNEIDFILAETQRLRLKYPKILIAPMLYRVEDNLLYHIKEK